MGASKLNARQSASAQLVRAGLEVPAGDVLAETISNGELKGRFVVEHWRGGQRINEYHFDNGIVNEGKDKLLNVMFDAATQLVTWYLGLIDNNAFTALAADDIYDDINQAGNGWDEFQNYNDENNTQSTLTRPTWTTNPASAQSISNTTLAIYNILGTATVKGIFAVGGTNAQTKGDHAPTVNFLWATALFTSGDVAVVNGDQLKVTYTVSA